MGLDFGMALIKIITKKAMFKLNLVCEVVLFEPILLPLAGFGVG